MGVLVFCAAAFASDDASLRSTLFGGLVASSAAATAFYFASKNADQARKDIMDATFGTAVVPDLTGRTVEQAHVTIARTAFELRVDPPDADPAATIDHQDPQAGSTVRKGSTVTVVVKP